MNQCIPPDYLERVYAGWLGKVIGVRHGGNVEGWSYEQLERIFGEITHYVHHFKNFAADDDTNGPMFFLRALEDFTHTRDITPEQMGLTWLNYAPDRHGFIWWGGYGKVTEQTAYVNLKNGIMAPRSGSIEQNGVMIAEQIGGQIFSDVWGLIAPGEPKLAAEYAEKMASVSHDGNGKYGGMFIAACIAVAFREKDIRRIIDEGLAVIPDECEFRRMTNAVIAYYENHSEDWRACFGFVKENFGYHLYPGGCHIIPNAAIIVLSLLYGGGDFARTINICNMCGWDTDCNVGNVGTILGVLNGLEGIDYSWRKPINDFLCCSSVIGSLNQLDLPWCAAYIAQFGYKLAGQSVPSLIEGVLNRTAPRFHFELPGSTHGFKTDADEPGYIESFVVNSAEAAASGERSLKVVFDKVSSGNGYRVYHQTYYRPKDFNDSRYNPSFSPILYPGQTIEACTMQPTNDPWELRARLYVKDGNSGKRHYGETVVLTRGKWEPLRYDIPALADACLVEAGIEFIPNNSAWDGLVAYVDDFHLTGKPDYSIDFRKEQPEFWHVDHVEVSQFSYHRGFWLLENGELSGSYAGEPAECYTGELNWKDYTHEAVLVPKLGSHHNIQFRVQGGIRSYAAGFAPNGKFKLYKNTNGYRELAEAKFDWETNNEYRIKVEAIGNRFRIFAAGALLIDYIDNDEPYLTGMIGFSNFYGSHTHYLRFAFKEC
ncbi:ADP-ribosylglycohydrolase family protein [Paenibacillus lignilyticus]|uniref:ADP-ribosylglycohydrolase family protein n=1 Tax=Paenibacillus lignilyticus TaxID=1172615 RepID=A0ABS5CN53_9BACL|nr:ADP-ribosylglycohydrolase family protein [Paenibacillus lignilyticus]MBP3967270.1 ADP-ribosylglycohydrolase family protein [Paenibacillus lignilyticus]